MNPTSTSEKAFLSEDFLLKSDFAKILYHDFARNLPIIDYHGHRYGKRATSSGRKVAWKTSE